jgi:hypothetical protein
MVAPVAFPTVTCHDLGVYAAETVEEKSAMTLSNARERDNMFLVARDDSETR